MISMRDALQLPSGVRLTDGGLRDDVLGQTHPANRSALVFLEAASRGATMEEALLDITHVFDIDAPSARRDMLITASRLNRHFLLNVRPTSWRGSIQSWLGMPSAMVVARTWPGANRRSPMVRGYASAVARSALAVVGGTLPMLAAMGVLGFGFGLLAMPSQLAVIALLGAALLGSMIAHECGHALALAHRREPFFFVADGWRVATVHRPPASAWVAGAGPVGAAVVGAGIGLAGLALGGSALFLASIPFAVQLAWLIPVTHDGRSVVRALKGRAR